MQRTFILSDYLSRNLVRYRFIHFDSYVSEMFRKILKNISTMYQSYQCHPNYHGNTLYILTLVILRSLVAWVQTLSGASRCFLEQETLHSLLSTGWFDSVFISL